METEKEEVRGSAGSNLLPVVTVLSLVLNCIFLPIVVLLGQRYLEERRESKIWEQTYASVAKNVADYHEEIAAEKVAALKSIYIDHLQLLEKQISEKKGKKGGVRLVGGFRSVKAGDVKSVSAEFDSVFSGLPKSIQGEVLSAIGSLTRANERMIDSVIGIVEKDSKYAVRVDRDLVKATQAGESRFNDKIVSDSGAVGRGQIMPKTGEAYGVRARDLVKPEHNTLVTVRFFADSYKRFNGNEKEMIASYEAGNYDRRGIDWKIKKHKGIDKVPYVQKFNTILLYIRAERKLREGIVNTEEMVCDSATDDTTSASEILQTNSVVDTNSTSAAQGQIASDDRSFF